MAHVETIQHQVSGAEFTIHEHGANIISWKPVVAASGDDDQEGREILFVSRDSKGLPIVGGIPLQFPIVTPYGAKDEMPEGGFLQHNNWTYNEDYRYDAKSDAACRFSLDFQSVTNERGHGLWAAAEPGAVAYMADCHYDVKVHGNTLQATLLLKNPQASRANTFPFQLLFHTYFRVANEAAMEGSECYVTGLENYIRQDKAIDSNIMEEQDKEPVVLKPDGETHYVFDPRGFMKKDLDVLIGIGEGRVLHMTAKATIWNDSHELVNELPVTCVVWNPHQNKARHLEGFNAAEWPGMIGVQPGILERQMLQPLHTLKFEYTLKLIAKEELAKETTFVRTSMLAADQTGPLVDEAEAQAES